MLTCLSVISYPLAIVNSFVAAGLVWLYFHRDTYEWHPPFRATLPVAGFFFATNVYLVVAPFVPPDPGQSIYDSLPYWSHCVVGWGVIAGGGVYWLVWAKLLPKIGRYELVRETTVNEIDGWERSYFVRKPLVWKANEAAQENYGRPETDDFAGDYKNHR